MNTTPKRLAGFAKIYVAHFSPSWDSDLMKKNAIRRAKVHIRITPPDAHALTDLAAKSNRSVQQVGRIAVSAALVGKKLDLESLSSYGGTWGEAK